MESSYGLLKGSGFGKRHGSQLRESGSSKKENKYNYEALKPYHIHITLLSKKKRKRIICYN